MDFQNYRCGTEPPRKRQKVEASGEVSSKELCYLIMLYMDHNVSKIKIKGQTGPKKYFPSQMHKKIRDIESKISGLSIKQINYGL